ncbi:polyphosphate polymerase domain-containing protein [Streptomyces sp. NBC_01775]|uniref:polyphosphate polymerase domain-containing protein n=1 Tax=Streptomyces sp. NBC_01775 TaxID=2975939 RepID=UPI002DDB3B91|nr:polyphosphate polymerase domain-containing protein [Streptomyces sp. NBC_01775]WSB77829.1 polyphosphate polymerase domain-containing protein [Streptomyces sp. NBC_01775]
MTGPVTAATRVAPAVRALARAALAAHPVGLAEVMERAPLLDRYDRCYLVPSHAFQDIAARLTDPHRDEPFRALSIGGRRWFGYHSVYYDTPGLRAYHDHRQSRRQRCKIRERLYEDTGERQFEIKAKGGRGQTLKFRRRLGERAHALEDASRSFLRRTLEETYGAGFTVPDDLRPSLVTDYTRATFVADGRRITCDAGLVCRDAHGNEVRAARDLVLVETKSYGHLTEADLLLHEHGHRAADFTKYASLGALTPTLPANRWRRALREVFTVA